MLGTKERTGRRERKKLPEFSNIDVFILCVYRCVNCYYRQVKPLAI